MIVSLILLCVMYPLKIKKYIFNKLEKKKLSTFKKYTSLIYLCSLLGAYTITKIFYRERGRKTRKTHAFYFYFFFSPFYLWITLFSVKEEEKKEQPEILIKITEITFYYCLGKTNGSVVASQPPSLQNIYDYLGTYLPYPYLTEAHPIFSK